MQSWASFTKGRARRAAKLPPSRAPPSARHGACRWSTSSPSSAKEGSAAFSRHPNRPHPEFPLSTWGPINNVRLTATECNCQSGFQCEVLPWATEGAIFASLETPEDRNCPSFYPLLRPESRRGRIPHSRRAPDSVRYSAEPAPNGLPPAGEEKVYLTPFPAPFP
jgi:hypothetical protein